MKIYYKWLILATLLFSLFGVLSLYIVDRLSTYEGIIVDIPESEMDTLCGILHKSMMEHPEFSVHYIYVRKNSLPSVEALAVFSNCYYRQFEEANLLVIIDVCFKYSTEAKVYGKPLYKIKKIGFDELLVSSGRGIVRFQQYRCKIRADSCNCVKDTSSSFW